MTSASPQYNPTHLIDIHVLPAFLTRVPDERHPPSGLPHNSSIPHAGGLASHVPTTLARMSGFLRKRRIAALLFGGICEGYRGWQPPYHWLVLLARSSPTFCLGLATTSPVDESVSENWKMVRRFISVISTAVWFVGYTAWSESPTVKSVIDEGKYTPITLFRTPPKL